MWAVFVIIDPCFFKLKMLVSSYGNALWLISEPIDHIIGCNIPMLRGLKRDQRSRKGLRADD